MVCVAVADGGGRILVVILPLEQVLPANQADPNLRMTRVKRRRTDRATQGELVPEAGVEPARGLSLTGF